MIENLILSKLINIIKLSIYSSYIFSLAIYEIPYLIPEKISESPLVPPVINIFPNPEAIFLIGARYF